MRIYSYQAYDVEYGGCDIHITGYNCVKKHKLINYDYIINHFECFALSFGV